MEIRESICDHIESFKCRLSHYGPSKSIRSYLPPQMNIKVMWKMWKSKSQAQKQRVCAYEKYRQIFCGKFNLGFGNPRQDTCSFCVSKVAEMRKRMCAAKQALITELRLHKLRAKKFFQLLKHPLDAETITVSIDMQ